jgi:hypothetical protein
MFAVWMTILILLDKYHEIKIEYLTALGHRAEEAPSSWNDASQMAQAYMLR